MTRLPILARIVEEAVRFIAATVPAGVHVARTGLVQASTACPKRAGRLTSICPTARLLG